MHKEGERVTVEIQNARDWNKKVKGERKFELYDMRDNAYTYYARGRTSFTDYTKEEINNADKVVLHANIDYINEPEEFVDFLSTHGYVISYPRLEVVSNSEN